MKISKFFSNDNNYGFIKTIDKYKIKYSKNLSHDLFNWDITSKHLNARNHCAAVSSTNVGKYFCEIVYFDSALAHNTEVDPTLKQISGINELSVNNSNFDEHYNLIGNGPVFSFAKKTQKILEDKGIKVRYKRKWINKLPYILKSIENDNLVAILLGSNYKNYHWILCTGYIITNEDEIILKIIDNWNIDFRYYIPGYNTLMLYTLSFELL